ncbi:hypothetical protein BHE74_00048635 [Ensete ventricosum]|nr:hypothetical protein GW17_00039685 [Ensete ventricosum]RWW45520.1 hypothetical protein BHE74_00048635 [Ensete ventricosum]
MSMGRLTCLLISILSTPFSNLLIFLTRTLLRLAMPIIQLHARAHFTWPPISQFLGGHGVPSGHGPPWDDQVLSLCDVGLGVAQYKRAVDAPKEAVDCVFCLCGIEEDDEVRELRCEHLFHRRCLDRWLAHRRAVCPLCRDALVPHGPVVTKSGEMDEEELDDTAAVWAACAPWWTW